MNKMVLKDNIGYLPTIDAPATSMNTVFEILSKADATRMSLNLKSVVVVFDQAIYANAVEIMWKNTTLFSNLVPRLGVFHTIGVLLSIIGKRFGQAGLLDLIIESGVIDGEGTASAILNGKAYNRAVRFHKLLFEAMMRLIWEEFLEWIEKEHNNEYEKIISISPDLQLLINDDRYQP